MSRHYGVLANEIQHTINSIQNMTTDEITRIYGITISEDGRLHDPTYGKDFNDIRDWATFCCEQDHYEQSESITQIEWE